MDVILNIGTIAAALGAVLALAGLTGGRRPGEVEPDPIGDLAP